MYFLQSSYYKFVHVSIYDLILIPLIFILVVIWGYLYKTRKEKSAPLYKYFHWALALKMIAVLMFCLAYLTVYMGDTLDYFNSTVALNNVLSQNPENYFQLMLKGNLPEFKSFFTPETGYVEGHMYRDAQTFFVIRLFSPIVLLGGESFMISSLIMSLISFIGIWKFYKLLCGLYPSLIRFFFISVLMIPSVLFWGSGLLKDSITMSAAAWISYSIFMVFFMRRKMLINVIAILVLSFLIISIKPYILVSLIPGLLIWVFFNQVKRIPNRAIRMLITPMILIVILLSATFVLGKLGPYLGVYGDVDAMITKAKVTQEDLKRSISYGSNYYDIGTIEPTVWGIMKKAPAAIMAGLFRPFIWEARNPFIALSGLENLGILLLLIFIIIKVGLINFFRAIGKDPFLTYALVFVLLFAFGVGLASTNFGALARYRIPLMPFFVSGLFILLDFYRKQKAEKEKEWETLRTGKEST